MLEAFIKSLLTLLGREVYQSTRFRKTSRKLDFVLMRLRTGHTTLAALMFLCSVVSRLYGECVLI